MDWERMRTEILPALVIVGAVVLLGVWAYGGFR